MLGFLAVAEAPLGCFEITASEFRVRLIIVNIIPVVTLLTQDDISVWKSMNENVNVFNYSVDVFSIRNTYAEEVVVENLNQFTFGINAVVIPDLSFARLSSANFGVKGMDRDNKVTVGVTTDKKLIKQNNDTTEVI